MPWVEKGSLQGPQGDPGVTVISQEDYDALVDKTGIYIIEV